MPACFPTELSQFRSPINLVRSLPPGLCPARTNSNYESPTGKGIGPAHQRNCSLPLVLRCRFARSVRLSLIRSFVSYLFFHPFFWFFFFPLAYFIFLCFLTSFLRFSFLRYTFGSFFSFLVFFVFLGFLCFLFVSLLVLIGFLFKKHVYFLCLHNVHF